MKFSNCARSILIILIITAFAMCDFGESAKASTYDDFNDNSLDFSKWIVDSDSDVTVTEIGGRLNLSILPTATGEEFGGGVDSILTLTGDFDIQVDFTLLSWPDENGVRSALEIGNENNGLCIERGVWGSEYKDDYYVMDSDAGLKGYRITSDQSGKLRLQRIGEVITGFYYDTTSGWQEIASYTNEEVGFSNTEPVPFSLSVWSHDDYFNPNGQSVTVAFDNIKYESKLFVLTIGVYDDVSVEGDIDAQNVYNTLKNMPNWADPDIHGNTSGSLIFDTSSWFAKSTIEEALNKMKISSQDTIVFYFSGHGGQLPDTGDETEISLPSRTIKDINGNIINIPAKLNSDDEYLAINSDLTRNEYISDDYLSNLFNAPNLMGVKKIFIIDACFSGGFFGDNLTSDTGDLEILSNYALLASAQEDAVANAAPDGSGVWTNALIPFLGKLSFDHFNEHLVNIRKELESKYGGLYLPLKTILKPGDTGVFEFNPVLFASDDFDTEVPLVSNLLESWSEAYGSKNGDINYNVICDQDADGDVDGSDLAIFSAQFTLTP